MAACAADFCLKSCELRLQVCHADSLASRSQSLFERRWGTTRRESAADQDFRNCAATAKPTAAAHPKQARCTQVDG
jgi:hypothetical protein